MKIVENGRAMCGIVMPGNPTPREEFAASELISYIKKISGIKLEITDQYENKIIIGEPDKNLYARELLTQEQFEELVPGPEGFLIYVKGNHLLLAGSSKNANEMERGTVYCIYELLESFLGCSLAAFSKAGVEAGEYIPKQKTIEIDDINYVKACADVSYRTAIVQYDAWAGSPNHKLNIPFLDWLCKNRYNRILTWSSIYEEYKQNGMLGEAIKRGLLFSVGHHEAIRLFLPHEGNEYFSEKYYETHPEFYKLLDDGSRYFMKPGDFDGQFILCTRNRECIETFAQNVITWLDQNPQVDIVTLWPNDGRADGCLCSACQKYTKTANYTYFVDEVSKIVSGKMPNVKIDQIAYNDVVNCESEIISPSVLIDESTWHTESGLRTVGKPDGSCLKDTVYEESLLSWQKAGAQVVYYDYFMGNYGAMQRWMPMADEMQAMCKRFVEKGILGLGTQIEVFNVWNNIFNFYTYGRTAYDTELSLEDNLNEFCKIFGGAAPMLKEIMLMGESVIDGQVQIQEAGEYLIQNIDKEKVYSLYEDALKAADTKLARNNVRLMRMVFRYSDLEVTSEKLDVSVPHPFSKAADKAGELWYINENFGSYLTGKEGYGAAFAVKKLSDAVFMPNAWYKFE